MVNKDGKVVAPSSETFQAAAANADCNSKPGYGVILANQPGATSWPLTAATWILLYTKPQDATATAEALKFFAWSYAKGDKMADELDYVPMPDKVVGDIKKVVVGRDQGCHGQVAIRCKQIAPVSAARDAGRRLFPVGRWRGSLGAAAAAPR